MTSSNEKGKSFYKKHFPAILSGALILTGILYVAAICHLFFTGGDIPYTRARVGRYLLWLAAPSAITVVLIIIGSVLRRIYGKDLITAKYQETATAVFRQKARLKKLLQGFDLESAPEEIKLRIKKARARKKDTLGLAVFASILALVPTVAILSNTDMYTIENLNGAIAAAAAVILGNALIASVYWGVYVITHSDATDEELFAIKDAVRENPALFKKPEAKEEKEAPKKKYILLGLRLSLLAVAATFIVLGIFNGGMADVLGKAIKICTECIGLG